MNDIYWHMKGMIKKNWSKAPAIDYIQVLDGPQVGELIESVGMKPGHASKFRSFLNGELRS